MKHAKTNKRTSDPWVACRESGRIMVMNDRGFTVASVPFGDSEAMANACLIAAAPDLLEALLWVIRNYNDAGVVGDRAIDMARSAIAKAKAGEP